MGEKQSGKGPKAESVRKSDPERADVAPEQNNEHPDMSDAPSQRETMAADAAVAPTTGVGRLADVVGVDAAADYYRRRAENRKILAKHADRIWGPSDAPHEVMGTRRRAVRRTAG